VALLITSRIRSATVTSLFWLVAIAIPMLVALSRMYRGMHHPLDVAGGVLVGIGAILVVLFACHAAGVAAERRA
jgi:undecaprenyl-diphosphatase